jgi:hypothetical protein
VERAGPVTARVEVSDTQGHSVTASVTGEGAVIPNSPPAVEVSFVGPSTCIQDGSRPCSLRVRAQATDPDDDPLTYAWSGCASGAAPDATCTVSQIGPVVARVEVSDTHEHTVTATLSGAGVPRPDEPPAVTVQFDGASQCTPLPTQPCTLDVRADVVDAGNQSLRYAWYGCASGTGARATCVVERPGPVSAAVEVSDGNHAPARAQATALGSNRPPDVHVGYVTLFPSGAIEILGNVQDPDEGLLCGRQYCGEATVTGACVNARLECTCLAGLEVFLVRTAASGTCTVTFSLKDSWEQIGTPAISFDVSNPQAWRR